MDGVPERNRTFDPLIKSQMLYRLSYRDMIGWDGWVRTSEMTESKSVALPLGYIPTSIRKWWRGADSNCRTRRELIYSQPRLATSLPLRKKWCRLEDLNPQPTDYKSVALPIELSRQMVEVNGLEPLTLCL